MHVYTFVMLRDDDTLKITNKRCENSVEMPIKVTFLACHKFIVRNTTSGANFSAHWEMSATSDSHEERVDMLEVHT